MKPREVYLVIVVVFRLLTTSYGANKGASAVGICALEQCSCEGYVHPSWLRVNCTLDTNQIFELTEESLPRTASDIELTGGREVTLGTLAFTNGANVQRVRVAGAGLVHVRRHAFLNLTSASTLIEIADCGSVHIETKAFAHTKGPVNVNINRCAYATVGRESFSWLLSLVISDVPRLELVSGAFLMDSSAVTSSRHGPFMKIHLQKVILPEFASNTFASSAAEIRLEQVEVRTVKNDAFSANTFNVVIAESSSFHRIESGAFAQKTFIINLEITKCHIHMMSSKAIQSGTSNLTIQHSVIDEISAGAVNITVATVSIIHNEFDKFRSRGFLLQSWNRLQIEHNSFGNVEENAIVAPFTYVGGADRYEFFFVENEIVVADPDSFKFVTQAVQSLYLNVVYESNYFAQECHCGIDKWLGGVLGNASMLNMWLGKSYCTVNSLFARCFNAPEENMRMKQFSDQVCGQSEVIKCEPPTKIPNIVTTEKKHTRFSHRNHKQEDSKFPTDRDKKIIGLVCLIALCGVILIVIITTTAWIKNKGYCANIKNAAVSSNTSCLSFFDRLFGFNNGSENARSISRLSVNEYTERHRLHETRMIEIDEPIQEYREEFIPMEDKATQTLPEELTKELLESLREKLDDPDNYVEAREMIEHLYELIKVEESCNNNPLACCEEHFNEDENLYDVIQIPIHLGIGKNKRPTVSVGTKAPSLERLEPFSPYNRQTALCHEYFEPRDKTIHLYAELTSCRQNVTKKDKVPKNNISSVPDVIAEQAVPRGPFLRAMREKMNGNSAVSPKATFLQSFELSTAVHPTSTQRSDKSRKSNGSNSSSKMINRPLPEKPKTFDPGEGTSCQKERAPPIVAS